MTRRPAARSPRVVAYTRVSTNEQETGIEVQRTTLRREAEHRGWTDVEWIEEGLMAQASKLPTVQCTNCGKKLARKLTSDNPDRHWYDPCPKCSGKVERIR